MSITKPAIPKGTRDFSPTQFARRAYIFDTIKKVFRTYGFMPIETPAMELLTTLTGKYGNEGDKLIFKILNSGDYLADVNQDDYTQKNTVRLIPQLCEKALRYDLTVPFARYVVQHFNEITFPFRRYQIQPVWRADRPQKGRYREFYQCDADVIGSPSLISEAELLKMTGAIFELLGVDIIIKLNNRKILAGIAEVSGIGEHLTDFTVALDKLDKIGWEKVREEMLQKNMSETAIAHIEKLVALSSETGDFLEAVASFVATSETGRKGIEETRHILALAKHLGLKAPCEFDVTLARGLNYYTGAIIEVKAANTEMGSICGGGRYDDLTGIFGMKDISGVGISFGADRIYDVLEMKNLFPENITAFSQVLIANLGQNEVLYALPLLNLLREKGIAAEIYPDESKMKKQMAYADKNGIPFVVIAGSTEIAEGLFTLKNMNSGEQKQCTKEDIVNILLTQ